MDLKERNILPHPFKRLLRMTVQGMISVCIFFFLLNTIAVTYEQLRNHARIQALNNLMPSFAELANALENRNHLNKEDFNDYRRYYKKVTEYVPSNADAYLLLGFCDYFLGKNNESISAFKKAMELAPSIFWPTYNLSVIYFRTGHYEEAISYAQRTLKINPQMTLKFMASSKIYLPIMLALQENNNLKVPSLQQDYIDSYKILILSCYHLKKFPEMFSHATDAIKSNAKDQASFEYYAGLAAFHLGKHQQAATLLRGSYELNPANTNALYFLGLSLIKLGENNLPNALWQEAQDIYKEKGPFILGEEKISPQIY